MLRVGGRISGSMEKRKPFCKSAKQMTFECAKEQQGRYGLKDLEQERKMHKNGGPGGSIRSALNSRIALIHTLKSNKDLSANTTHFLYA